jgi:hypothetical protein
VVNRDGQPARRIWVQLLPVENGVEEGTGTDTAGHYEIDIIRPGRYYLGVNMNNSPMRDTPYPHWFYPGTADPNAATIIYAGNSGRR